MKTGIMMLCLALGLALASGPANTPTVKVVSDVNPAAPHKASLRHLLGTLGKRSMKISGVAKRGRLIHGQGLGRLGRRSNATQGTPPHAISKLPVTTYRPFPLRQRLRRPTPVGRRRHFSTSPTGPPPGYEPRYADLATASGPSPAHSGRKNLARSAKRHARRTD